MIAHYSTTPDEAQPIADRVIEHLSHKGWKCQVEVSYHVDAPLTTVVLATKGVEPTWLIEPQARPAYGTHISKLSNWLKGRREYVCFSIATTADAEVSGRMLTAMKADGVGLIIVDDLNLAINRDCVSPALVIHLDPTIILGKHKARIMSIVEDFNVGNRVGALRDMCELVEGETGKLISRACAKGVVALTSVQIDAMRWANQIDSLRTAGVIDENLKIDLNSLRSARNLFDHPTTTRGGTLRRNRQCVERMHMGARLAGDLLSVARGIK